MPVRNIVYVINGDLILKSVLGFLLPAMLDRPFSLCNLDLASLEF